MSSRYGDNYDDCGNWIREDRPELLSDRLGYPSERGDEDWARIQAAREQCPENERQGAGRHA
jgi:hypothetical protein